MAYRLEEFAGVGLDEALLRLVLNEHASAAVPRLEKLWTYYRNPLRPIGVGSLPWPGAGGETSGRGWYRQAQEMGLPSRLVGKPGLGTDDRAASRREVVVENDIAWRIHAMVDFMFGRPVTVLSTARDEGLRRTIERVLDAVWEASGGITLFQDAALLGHVYGHVDLLLRVRASAMPRRGSLTGGADGGAIARAAEALRVEIVEPTRGVALLDPADYRTITAYLVAFERELNEIDAESGASGFGGLWRRAAALKRAHATRKRSSIVEIFSGTHHQLYQDEELVEERAAGWTGGEVPVVHIQNVSQPFRYEGLGEVEPLIPLQDELNTRLSDRASRVTMQSFKMYLAKGLEGFDKSGVGPGQIFSTDNPGAFIQEFGGDAASPSEEAHITEVREALDKVSSVPPLAGGVVRGKIGDLSSANALKITLMGILAKTARKRVAYGRGIARMSRLILTALDTAGALETDEMDRGVRLEWPDPLPADVREQVAAAEVKSRLGVPHERVLAELGYSPSDPGVQ